MPTTLPRLPAARLAPLALAYDGAVRLRRRRLLLGTAVVLLLALLAGRVAEVDPARLLAEGGGFFGYFDRLLTLESGPAVGQRVWMDPAEWLWGWRGWLGQLGDTLLIAYVGTLLGAAGAFLLGLLAAANLVPNPWARGAVRRLLEVCRTVPDLVFALVFVIAFGLGPLPGVLAIAIHSLGALGKLFSEIVENIEMRPVEGAAAAGAAWPAMVRYAVLPQVLPGFAGYALLRFEINVRQASVMGFVGAGGIGQDLIEAIRKFYYNDVAALLLIIIATVIAIDLATERLRHALIGAEDRA
ncbi:phosphonate ABC transporter, permease protein PhnE [Roseicella aquatilis]|uniref:Phosphonate ABC transporter, permease protein PhnE n=1 Tax=Roseicella aquatilis TaxID=2527868 RepID=A0A4R4DRP4_9PROT|nr:phosphonate ABC transporter, permease protein PhnE [Roseicella aquatilis]TCZ64959.1 phosphonate ABC transporter, permease protein PhnE [Roseicella aquatilis]